MKAVIPIFLIAIVVGVAAFFIVDPLHDRAAAYKSENERVQEQFAPPPLAQVVTSEQKAYEADGINSILNRAEGWVLTTVYGVPEAMTIDEVTAWYQENLPEGWTAELNEIPDGANPQTGQPNPPIRHLIMVSGEKQVVIDLMNMNPGKNQTYQVAIDYKGASGS